MEILVPLRDSNVSTNAAISSIIEEYLVRDNALNLTDSVSVDFYFVRTCSIDIFM